jgi:predicted branched-subunit amino acid permease
MTALAPARRRAVLRQSMSVGVATGAYGISFGALSTAAGLSLLQTQALSLLLFSGGSQFAFVGLVAGGVSGAPAAIATSTLLGVRNGLYGLQVARLLDVRGLRRAVAAHLTIDESTAVGVAQPEERAGRLGFWATGAAVFVLWNLMTLAGALVGDAIGDPRTYGLDAAAAAAFCGLLWPRLKSRDAVAIAVLAALVAVVLAPHAPAGVPVLVAALTALLGALWPSAHRDPPPPHHWADEASEHPGAAPSGGGSPAGAAPPGEAPPGEAP